MKIKQTLQEPMNTYNIISLHAHPEWRIPAARWFQEKWEIPLEEYLTSIDESIKGTIAVPQWYIVIEGQQIIAGAGVIENDFHDRKDLTPNICGTGTTLPRHCRTAVGTYLQGYGCKRYQHPLPHHGAYLVLRTLWLGIPVHGEGRRWGTDADV